MQAKKKKVVKWILNVIFIIFIVFMATVIVLSLISKKSGKQIFSYSILWVLTNSMEDTIPAQSYILVKKADASQVEIGEVITFISTDAQIEGALNTHRVVDIKTVGDTKFFQTKGDHNPTPDAEWVSADRVVAKYVRNLPMLTFFGRFFASTAGLGVTLSLIVVGTGICVLVMVKKSKKETKQEEIDKRISEEVARLNKEGLTEEDKNLLQEQENKEVQEENAPKDDKQP